MKFLILILSGYCQRDIVPMWALLRRCGDIVPMWAFRRRCGDIVPMWAFRRRCGLYKYTLVHIFLGNVGYNSGIVRFLVVHTQWLVLRRRSASVQEPIVILSWNIQMCKGIVLGKLASSTQYFAPPRRGSRIEISRHQQELVLLLDMQCDCAMLLDDVGRCLLRLNSSQSWGMMMDACCWHGM